MKEIIISSAKTLFAEKGYAGTGLRDIAEKADVSLGNIYNYFKNKEEIFKCLLNPDVILDSLADMQGLLSLDFISNLDKLILKLKGVIDANIDLYRLIFIDLIEFGGYNTNRIIEGIIAFLTHIYNENVERTQIGGKLKNFDYPFLIKPFVVSAISFFVVSNILPSVKTEKYSDADLSEMIAEVIRRGIVG